MEGLSRFIKSKTHPDIVLRILMTSKHSLTKEHYLINQKLAVAYNQGKCTV